MSFTSRDCRTVLSHHIVNVFLIIISIFVPHQSAFVLEGSSSSYAQFPSWQPDIHSSFSLEFRTDQSDTLLWYSQHHSCQFIEVKIVGGQLRARLNFGVTNSGAHTVTIAGNSLSDNQWHRLKLVKDASGNTTVAVDDSVSDIIACHGSEDGAQKEEQHSSDQFVYIGGLPSWYNSKLKVTVATVSD